MDEPDTYSGAKYVSRVNKVAQPHPSGGDLYGLPRAVDPMLLRALQQRQSQTPMRSVEGSDSFFEAGTHGQAFVRGTLGQVGARPAANDQNWSLIRMGMDARDQERKEQERSEDSRGHSDAGHT
jgi:hypothetical protein